MSTMISNTNGAGADCMCVYNECYILCLCGLPLPTPCVLFMNMISKSQLLH
jgi:hypothetical protein